LIAVATAERKKAPDSPGATRATGGTDTAGAGIGLVGRRAAISTGTPGTTVATVSSRREAVRAGGTDTANTAGAAVTGGSAAGRGAAITAASPCTTVATVSCT
jgi:hypothetical protein